MATDQLLTNIALWDANHLVPIHTEMQLHILHLLKYMELQVVYDLSWPIFM